VTRRGFFPGWDFLREACQRGSEMAGRFCGVGDWVACEWADRSVCFGTNPGQRPDLTRLETRCGRSSAHWTVLVSRDHEPSKSTHAWYGMLGAVPTLCCIS
jgi:hypothetical protein